MKDLERLSHEVINTPAYLHYIYLTLKALCVCVCVPVCVLVCVLWYWPHRRPQKYKKHILNVLIMVKVEQSL